MADLPDLNVKITADTSSLDAALKKTQDSAKKFGDAVGGAATETDALTSSTTKAEPKLKSTGNTISDVSTNAKALSISLAAAATAITAISVKSAQASRDLVAMSKQAGVGVEEFQKLAFAAQSVGVQQDKLGDIFKDSRDKIGDFLATGGGELKDFFETVAPLAGVTAQEFAHLSGPQILQKFQKALDDANVSANQQVFFLESIADEASRLQPLLTNNAAALNEYTKRAEELNIVLSSVEIARLAEVDKHVTEIGKTLEVAAGRAVGELVPAFRLAGDAAASLANNVDLLIKAGELAAIVLGARVAAGAAAAVVQLRVYAATAGIAATATRGLTASMALLGGPVGLAVVAAGALFAFREELNGTAAAANRTKTEVDKLTTGIGNMTQAQLANKAASIRASIAETEVSLTQLNTKMEVLEQRKSLQDITNQGRPGAASAEVRNLNGDIQELTESLGAQKQALEDINAISPFAPKGDGEGEVGAFSSVVGSTTPGAGRDTSEEDMIAELTRQMEMRRQIMEEFDAFEAERNIEKFEADKERLALAAENELITAEQKNEALRQLEEDHMGRMHEIYNRDANNRMAAQANANKVIESMRQQNADRIVGILSVLGQKHKAFALAAIAIDVARGVSQNIIATQVASMRALSDLGPILGPPVAAGIQAQGALGNALIVGAGALQAVGTLSSGSSSASAGASASGTTSSGTSGGGTSSPSQQSESSIVNINLEGEVFGREQVRSLIGSINEALDDGARLRIS